MTKPEEVEVMSFEADNGTVVIMECYLKRAGRHFEVNLHLEKWEHPDVIAGYLGYLSELLREKKAIVNTVEISDS